MKNLILKIIGDGIWHLFQSYQLPKIYDIFIDNLLMGFTSTKEELEFTHVNIEYYHNIIITG